MGSFKKNQIKSLVGEYVIDLENTTYKGYELEEVEDLKLILNKDGTFLFNKDYPFLYDSAGIWIPRKPGLDKWNLLVFNRKSYVDNKSHIDCQFADSWKGGRPVTNSVLQLNCITPKKGQKPIYVIYLNKVQCP